MKKINSWIMMMIMMLAMTSSIFAGQYADYQIKVKIVAERIAITTTAYSLDFGYVVQGTSVTSGGASTAVKNIGAVNIDLKAKISGSPSGWTPGTSLGDTGQDKYVLAMVFHTWDGLVQSTNPYSCFGDEDVLTTDDKPAGISSDSGGTDVFAAHTIANQAVGTPTDNDGVDIPPDPNRAVNSLFFFNAPTSLSNQSQYNQEQTITVTLTAQQHQ